MKTLTIGSRVNVSNIITENWQSEKFIKNGILIRFTDRGIPVVSVDEKSEHSHNFIGGCLHPSGYTVSPVE